MKTSKTTNLPASINDTKYVLRIRGAYVTTWTQHGWTYDTNEDVNLAWPFVSMTQALCVGFCLGLADSMEAVAITPAQAPLPL